MAVHPATPGVSSREPRPVLTVARNAAAAHTNDMDHIVPIFLVCIATCGGEPLNDALRRRSVYGVYADDFADEYEPVAVAAFPVHQPVQVLRLLSSASTSPSYSQHKRSVPRIQPQREYRDQYVYASPSEPEYAYSYEDDYEQPIYSSSSSQAKYTKYSSPYSSPASYEEYEAAAPAPVVVYARPNKNGGYTYRQKSRPALKHQEPVIIRVHKYKVVRE